MNKAYNNVPPVNYNVGTPEEIEKQRIENFPKSVMVGLQRKIQTFSPAVPENMTEKFNKNAYSKGKNVDEFVSFLDFLGETSKKSSKIINESDNKRLEDILKNLKI
jgi:hypothetical protein